MTEPEVKIAVDEVGTDSMEVVGVLDIIELCDVVALMALLLLIGVKRTIIPGDVPLGS